MLCIGLVSGCTKQPAGGKSPTNVLPSPATDVTINHIHYKLIEFNGDSFDGLAKLWSKIPQKVQYCIYGVSAFVGLLLSAHVVFSFLARIGVVTDYHRITGIAKLTDEVKGIKDEFAKLNNQVLVDIPTHVNNIAAAQNVIAQKTTKTASTLELINMKKQMPLNMRSIPSHKRPFSGTPPPSSPSLSSSPPPSGDAPDES